METFDNFKNECITNSICEFIISKRPIPKTWGFPDFLKNNDTMLKKFFGKSYEFYNLLSDNDKKSAIEWYETHGEYVVSLLETICYEDYYDGAKVTINLRQLSDNHPMIYKEVVNRVSNKVYLHLGKHVVKIIVDKFIESPETFEEEINKQH